MSQQWRQNTQGFRIKFKNQSAIGNFLTLFAIFAAAAFLLFVGVWIFFLLLTIGVLLLPWLWWKRRQLIKKMQQAATYQSTSTTHTSATTGRVFEGEVITTEVIENKQKTE